VPRMAPRGVPGSGGGRTIVPSSPAGGRGVPTPQPRKNTSSSGVFTCRVMPERQQGILRGRSPDRRWCSRGTAVRGPLLEQSQKISLDFSSSSRCRPRFGR
jgi:hypothetical protein